MNRFGAKGSTTRQLLVFLGAFLFLTGLEYTFRREMGPFVNGVLNVRAGTALINAITPAEAVVARGNRIESSTTSIEVAQGCEGVDVMLMFLAAMVAMPLALRRKLVGSLVGIGVIYVANLLRLAGLWYCLKYTPSRFESMHVVVGQTAIIVVAIAVFAAVTGLFSRLGSATTPAPERVG